jgi:hypothetical protein
LKFVASVLLGTKNSAAPKNAKGWSENLPNIVQQQLSKKMNSMYLRIHLCIIATCLGVLLYSCREEKKVVLTSYPSGNPKSVWIFEIDTLDGIKELYWENGNLSARFSYARGKKNGPFILFYKNGNPAQSGETVDNQIRGVNYQYFVDDSAKVEIESYELLYKGMAFNYYKRTFDKAGRLVDDDKFLSLEGRAVGWAIHYRGDAVFDSMKVAIGQFGEDFQLDSIAQADTISFVGDSLILKDFPRGKNRHLLRGVFWGYENHSAGDTIKQKTLVRFFEEPVDK